MKLQLLLEKSYRRLILLRGRWGGWLGDEHPANAGVDVIAAGRADLLLLEPTCETDVVEAGKNGSVRFVDAGCVPTFFVFNGSVGVFVSTSVGGT